MQMLMNLPSDSFITVRFVPPDVFIPTFKIDMDTGELIMYYCEGSPEGYIDENGDLYVPSYTDGTVEYRRVRSPETGEDNIYAYIKGDYNIRLVTEDE